MKLSITPDEAWERSFWQNSQDKLSGFKPQHFSNTLYAACVLDLTIPETVKPLVQSTVTSNTEEDIRHLHAMYSAKDYLEAQGINLVFKENTPEKLRQSEDTRVSQLEKKTGFALAKVLQSMRPQTLLNAQHFIRSTASPVDFFIELCGDQGLVIQVDDPSHFLDNGTERQCVNGFTAFQTRQFQTHGYQVLCLPYDLLNKYGVYDIKHEHPPVPEALSAYLKEQLTPYLALAT
ncbi:MAG: RAP domain-containing protein [Holosporaceae bacterium]